MREPDASTGHAKLDAGHTVATTQSDASRANAQGTDAAAPSTVTKADASSPANALDASSPDASSTATSSLPPDPGKGDGSDVVTLGDSWMSNTLQLEGTGGGISPSLIAASKQNYTNYAVQGVMLLNTDLFGPAIPTQWDAAIARHPTIKTVIMTGGGNDILQDSGLTADCKADNANCEAELDKIASALTTLWTKMSAAGVQDIVHVEYSANAGGMTLKNPAANMTRLQKICDAVPAPTRCHLVPTDALVGNDLAADGIHPLQGANDRVAAALVKLMADQHIRR